MYMKEVDETRVDRSCDDGVLKMDTHIQRNGDVPCNV